ncbi:MAG: glycosyltransferase [Sedimentisphaerales bacterium]|nr:glycosyltransferase [Sedimentisphaerales bacterium]
MAFEVVCCIRLKDSVARHHLMPIAANPLVSKLWIIRHEKLDYGDIPKAQYILVPSRFKLWRFIRMIYHALRLGRRKQVKAFVSFNPLPYGLLSYIAAKYHKKIIHFGFIGKDWNVYLQHTWQRIFMPIVRRANLITVPGPTMRQEMIQHHIPPQNIMISPHGTDLERFPVADPDQAKYTCVFVGELVPLKRLDTILHAWALVNQKHPNTRFCIVGQGPQAPQLRMLAESLKITHAVDFLGHVTDVHPHLAASKFITMASTSEGFPSALVEAMSTGLIPITTPVGCIPDIIQHQHNGLIFPINNHQALAQHIIDLLENPKLYNQLRQNILNQRQSFSHQQTYNVWNQWLKSIDA